MALHPTNPTLNFGESVWAIVNAKVGATPDVVNLGQGFPTWPAPGFVKQAAVDAIEGDLNQYTSSRGHPRLLSAIAAEYGLPGGVELGPENVAVSVGGCEALCAAFFALITPNEGQEILLLEPFFDCYDKQIALAGGVAVYVPLTPPPPGSVDANEWALDMDALEAAVSPNTRGIVINTPHNPLGKVFSRTELQGLADFATAHNLVVISDEVYDRLAYDHDAPHVSIAELDGMFDRTLRIGSAGKTFSVTGWKVGWASGPKDLVQALWLARQWMTFTLAAPLQEAVAVAFEKAGPGGEEEGYYDAYREDLKGKRELMVSGLRAAGLNPIVPRGSYFCVCNISHLEPLIPAPEEGEDDEGLDMRFTKWLISEIGVACIPCGWAFYSEAHRDLGSHFVRFCFAKSDDLIASASSRLLKINDLLDQHTSEQ